MSKTESPLASKYEIGSPSEIIRYLNLLVYGEPGVGKTVLAGSAQDHEDTSPILLLDVEGGTVSLRRRTDIDVIRVKSFKQLIDIHNELAVKNDGHYKTVVIDSLSELQKLDMGEIMRELANRRPDLDPDVPSQREWGKSSEHMRRVVRGFRDLPMNTIMTALAQSEKGEDNVIRYYPSLPGKLRTEVPGFMDVVGYMYVKFENEEVKRTLQVVGSRRVVAKDRTDSLGGAIEGPTIPDMWHMINTNGKP